MRKFVALVKSAATPSKLLHSAHLDEFREYAKESSVQHNIPLVPHFHIFYSRPFPPPVEGLLPFRHFPPVSHRIVARPQSHA